MLRRALWALWQYAVYVGNVQTTTDSGGTTMYLSSFDSLNDIFMAAGFLEPERSENGLYRCTAKYHEFAAQMKEAP